MIKLYRKYKIVRKLKHILDTFDTQEIHIDKSDWLKRAKSGTLSYFDNDQGIRDLLAQILIRWRKREPYRPQYRESKKLYEEYFKMEGHIPSFDVLKEGDYLVKFRSEAPVKGERYNEYYTNDGFPNRLGTYKLGKKDEKYNYFKTEIDYYGEGVSDDFFTSFRYATDEEVKKYDEDIKRYRELEKKIKMISKVLDKIRKEKDKIFKN